MPAKMQAFFYLLHLTIIKRKGEDEVRLSELSGKEIVDARRAERLGVLGQTDLEINEQTGQIQALLIPTGKWFRFRKEGSEIRVPWKYIKKVGTDMIIIDFPDE
jgi:YlmC/YmxH family sporulation protein